MVKLFIKKLIIILTIIFLISSISTTAMANNTGSSADPFASLIGKVDAGNDSTNASQKVQKRICNCYEYRKNSRCLCGSCYVVSSCNEIYDICS